MNLYKDDLLGLGHKAFDHDGKLMILNDLHDDSGVFQIMLREVLALFDHSISAVGHWGPEGKDPEEDEEGFDACYLTTMPWSEYQMLAGSKPTTIN